MRDEWVIDVLADLKSFSRRNGLHAVAEQLDDTMLVAATELASRNGGTYDAVDDAQQAGDRHRAPASGNYA